MYNNYNYNFNYTFSEKTNNALFTSSQEWQNLSDVPIILQGTCITYINIHKL